MAAKGSILKEEIVQKILETFEGSFINGKEIRIRGTENGEDLQIKLTLTCAKVNVEPEESSKLPEPKTPSKENVQTNNFAEKISPSVKLEEPTEEEKKNIVDLLERLKINS